MCGVFQLLAWCIKPRTTCADTSVLYQWKPCSFTSDCTALWWSAWCELCGIIVLLFVELMSVMWVFCCELMALLVCRCGRMSSGVERWNMWAWCQNWTICHRSLSCCMKTQPRTLALRRGNVKFIVQIKMLILKIDVKYLFEIHMCLWEDSSQKWSWMSSSPSFLTASDRNRSAVQNVSFKQCLRWWTVSKIMAICPARNM